MAFSPVAEPIATIPLKMSADDVIRIGDTRGTLDTVIEAFEDGATPEEVVDQYSSLDLADVYAVLGYYLHHRAAVDDYYGQRRRQAQVVRRENERRFVPAGVRERLLRRR